MRMLSALLVVITLALSGCTDRPAPAPKAVSGQQEAAVVVSGTPTQKVQLTVRRYNQLLAQGYRSLNMNPLQEVATTEQAEKAYVHMAAIGEGKAKMVSNLKKLSFLKTEFPQPDLCQVATDEVWDFAYHDIGSGAKTGEQKDFLYHVSYKLQLKGERWLITDIVASSEEPGKAPGQGK
jgi:hypothetical protein